MKTKIILSIALVASTLLTISCEGGNDSCVEDNIEAGMNQSEAEDKCDEELVETVEEVIK